MKFVAVKGMMFDTRKDENGRPRSIAVTCDTAQKLDFAMAAVITAMRASDIHEYRFFVLEGPVSEDRLNHYLLFNEDDLKGGEQGTIKEIDGKELFEEYNKDYTNKLRIRKMMNEAASQFVRENHKEISKLWVPNTKLIT